MTHLFPWLSYIQRYNVWYRWFQHWMLVLLKCGQCALYFYTYIPRMCILFVYIIKLTNSMASFKRAILDM